MTPKTTLENAKVEVTNQTSLVLFGDIAGLVAAMTESERGSESEKLQSHAW